MTLPRAEFACAARVDLRLGPGDHFRKTAASTANAADAECDSRADRNRHHGRLTSSPRRAALSLASSPNSATLTFGISGGPPAARYIDGVTYDVSKAGPYGTLYVDSTTGAYTFVPNSDAINALMAPTTTSFTITVSGRHALGQSDLHDRHQRHQRRGHHLRRHRLARRSRPAASPTPRSGTLTATGTLTDTDVDDAPNTFAAVSSPTASAHGYGTFTMTAAGVWTYTLNDANSAVQALNVGDTLTDTFTVTTIDGTAQVVTVTINGANDAAIISGATTGSVTEDGGVVMRAGMPTATGTLTDTDVDNTPNAFTAVSSPTASDGGYGTFTMTADGVWTYTLDNANCAVQALNVGDTLTDTFTVTTMDGTAQVVTVTINGTNDAAIICGTTHGLGRSRLAARPMPSWHADRDRHAHRHRRRQYAQHLHGGQLADGERGGYGTFTMTADGVWTYTLDNAN